MKVAIVYTLGSVLNWFNDGRYNIKHITYHSKLDNYIVFYTENETARYVYEKAQEFLKPSPSDALPIDETLTPLEALGAIIRACESVYDGENKDSVLDRVMKYAKEAYR